jgi:hypothetical protein
MLGLLPSLVAPYRSSFAPYAGGRNEPILPTTLLSASSPQNRVMQAHEAAACTGHR